MFKSNMTLAQEYLPPPLDAPILPTAISNQCILEGIKKVLIEIHNQPITILGIGTKDNYFIKGRVYPFLGNDFRSYELEKEITKWAYNRLIKYIYDLGIKNLNHRTITIIYNFAEMTVNILCPWGGEGREGFNYFGELTL